MTKLLIFFLLNCALVDAMETESKKRKQPEQTFESNVEEALSANSTACLKSFFEETKEDVAIGRAQYFALSAFVSIRLREKKSALEMRLKVCEVPASEAAQAMEKHRKFAASLMYYMTENNKLRIK